MWRGGSRVGLSVAGSFVWRCPSNLAVTPFPHPAHRTGHADLPHRALGQSPGPSPRHAFRLELRPLPSTGITRLQRYYKPLRHPTAPGLSLAGVRLIIPDHALGLPVLRALSLYACCRHYPGAAARSTASLIQPSRVSLPRYGSRVGLRIDLFEACSAFTRVTACTLALSPYFVTRFTRRLQPCRYLHSCSGASGWSGLPGGACTHWKSAALSRRTPEADVRVCSNHSSDASAQGAVPRHTGHCKHAPASVRDVFSGQ
jgi:hypothetical protein